MKHESVMNGILLYNPHFCWSSAFDLLCRKFNWINYRLVYNSVYMQVEAV